MCGKDPPIISSSDQGNPYDSHDSLFNPLHSQDQQEKFHQRFPSLCSPGVEQVSESIFYVWTPEKQLYDIRHTLFNPLNTRRRRDECHNMFRFTCEPIYKAVHKSFTNDKVNERCAGRQLLRVITRFCKGWQLRECANPECRARKQVVLKQLPPCTWEALREWMATAVSCWQTESFKAESDPEWKARTLDGLDRTLSASGWRPGLFRFGVPYIGLLECVNLDDAAQSTLVSNPCIDIVGVFNLFYWHYMTFDDETPTGGKFLQSWTDYHLLYEPCFVREAMRLDLSPAVRSVGICPSRFWNLAVEGSESYITVLSTFIGVALGDLPPRGDKHKGCTSQFCNFANDNSTGFTQLHKCNQKHGASPGGDEITFPMKELEIIFKSPLTSWVPSSWDVTSISLLQPRINLDPASKYMALSHVWSDGTGVGMKEAGSANRCLVEYFQSIAQCLGCNGIWWDAICLPSSRVARRRALDQMLENFERASFMVIHDMELVNFEWRDDGTPALALMLSPWFTRGWTAAEFFAARQGPGRVKVLFKSPDDSGQPCIKDLEDEVLAPIRGLHQGRFTNLPHLVASEVIRQVSGDVCNPGTKAGYRISDLNVLLRILRPRTTSWARDRMVLGALLTLPRKKFDTSRTEPELVTDILRTIKHLPGTAIYHGEIPIAQHGPWSWCPPTVFDFGRTGTVLIPSAAEGQGEGCELTVKESGVVEGVFTIYHLHESDLGELLPCGTHPSMEARIRNALVSFAAGCPTLIMQVEGQVWRRHIDLWLLAVPVATPLYGKTTDLTQGYPGFDAANRWRCRWVGCVYAGNTRRGDFYGERLVTFGEDVDDAGNPASAVVPPDEAVEEAKSVLLLLEKHKRERMERDEAALSALYDH
ncbi:hypothetical protein F4820DRAFT_435190 [Hypoxylon rubiginosum]|uniref:Uncharacterized protein n=1 Tax=Hypoxylon rubiginosum TaxID=110542 RepID=A0ACB9YPE1_9PEZI|nr:hypothetical protein F4820DRAFT_435190 [Hypoxylon rubiginosum]